MRHLFVFGDRVDSLADWRGGLIRSLRSETVYAVLAALNAKPDDVGNDNARTAADIADGSLLGAESSFTDALRMPKLPNAVSNVTLFPKVEALVVKSRVFEQLSKSERERLREAASQTVVDAVADSIPDAAAAEEFCSRGGSMLTASASEIDQIRQGFDSVYQWLEQDPSTAALIEKIAAAVAEIPAPPPSCPDPEPSPTPTSIVTSTGRFRVLSGWKSRVRPDRRGMDRAGSVPVCGDLDDELRQWCVDYVGRGSGRAESAEQASIASPMAVSAWD